MPLEISVTGMLVCVLIWVLTSWREKKKQLGDVPIIPHIYIKFFTLIVFLVFAANFVSEVSGVTWKSPFRR